MFIDKKDRTHKIQNLSIYRIFAVEESYACNIDMSSQGRRYRVA